MSEQCKETYRLPNGETAEYGCHTFSCVREAGHEGQHFDHFGNWRVNRKRVEIVPIAEAQREMNIKS